MIGLLERADYAPDSDGGLFAGGRPRMAALREFLDHFPIEGQQIVGLAARNDPAMDDDFLVDPLGARILEVFLERRPRSDPEPAHRVGFDQRPRTMADHRDRLA